METLSQPQSPPGTKPAKKKLPWKAWLAIATVAVVVLGVLFVAVPPVYAEAKLWRAGQFAAHGARAFERQDWEEAILQYRLARQMEPGNIAYLREIARASERISPVRAIETWRSVMSRSDVSLVERQDYAAFLLRMGQLDLAHDQLRRLMRVKPIPVRALSLSSDFYLMRGDRERATAYARQALVVDPSNDEAQLKLGALLAGSETPKERRDGRAFLWELAGRPNDMRLAAWKRLVATGELTPAEAEQIHQWLQASEHLAEEPLLSADLRIIYLPAQQDALILEAAASVTPVAVTNDQKLAEAAIWLNQKKAFQRTLALLPLDRAGTNTALFSSHLDAKVGLRQWPEIEALLTSTNHPFSRVSAISMRAHVAAQRGDRDAAEQLWRAAIAAGTNEFRLTYEVALQAERLGRPDMALMAYAPLLESERFGIAGLLEANRQTYRIARGTQRYEDARRAATRLARVNPEDEAAAITMLYLNLMLKQQLPQSLSTAIALSRRHSENPNFRILTAYAHLRNGDPKRALTMADDLSTPVIHLSPQWRAMVLAIMKANGRITDQVRLSESLENSGFSKEELRLLLN